MLRHQKFTRILLGLFLVASAAFAQVPQPIFPPWIQFTDQTATRLSLLPGGLNDSWEKDIATGDLDQDGRTDAIVVRKLAFSNPGATSDILLMNINGVLTDSTALYAPGFYNINTDARDVVIDDFDLDGWLDVVIATTFVTPQPNALMQVRYYRNLGRNLLGNWLGLRDESAIRIPLLDLSQPPLSSPQQFCAVASGDVTGDGLPELYITNYSQGATSVDVLLYNIGFGLFQDISSALGDRRNSAFGSGVELKDIDGDGDNDFIKTSAQHVVAPWNSFGVFHIFNNGGPTPPWTQAPGLPSNPSIQAYMFTVADFNNDNRLDMYVVDDRTDYTHIQTNSVPDTSVTYNTFAATSTWTNGFGGNVKAADLDRDGFLDVGVADIDVNIFGCTRRFALLRNNGQGQMSDPWGATVNPWNQSTHDFAFLDIDGDGKLDLLQGQCNSYAVFIQQ